MYNFLFKLGLTFGSLLIAFVFISGAIDEDEKYKMYGDTAIAVDSSAEILEGRYSEFSGFVDVDTIILLEKNRKRGPDTKTIYYKLLGGNFDDVLIKNDSFKFSSTEDLYSEEFFRNFENEITYKGDFSRTLLSKDKQAGDMMGGNIKYVFVKGGPPKPLLENIFTLGISGILFLVFGLGLYFFYIRVFLNRRKNEIE